MTITYPPELLPVCDEGEAADVIVCDLWGKPQLVIQVSPPPSQESAGKLPLISDLS